MEGRGVPEREYEYESASASTEGVTDEGRRLPQRPLAKRGLLPNPGPRLRLVLGAEERGLRLVEDIVEEETTEDELPIDWLWL